MAEIPYDQCMKIVEHMQNERGILVRSIGEKYGYKSFESIETEVFRVLGYSWKRKKGERTDFEKIEDGDWREEREMKKKGLVKKVEEKKPELKELKSDLDEEKEAERRLREQLRF